MKNNEKFAVINKKSQEIIEKFMHRNEAEKAIKKYECSDKLSGIYEPNFYQIIRL